MKYAVILASGDKISVEGKFEITPSNVLLIRDNQEVVQAFAAGAWITIFKIPTIHTNLTDAQKTALMANQKTSLMAKRN